MTDYPTRVYSYRRGGLEALDLPPVPLEAGAIYRFIMGRDRVPVRLSQDELSGAADDPFARQVLLAGHRPLTVHNLLEAVSRAKDGPGGLPEQRVFVVADGGQIPWSEDTRNLKRSIRLLVARGVQGGDSDLFVSAGPPFDENEFLQVIGWDAKNRAYNFYDRRMGAWIHAGSSWDALEPATRGLGPFDSHVNGALNMKELKLPWVHWHSQSLAIQDHVLAPDDPVRNDPLWQSRVGAQELEREIVRPGIRRWTNARFDRASVDGRIEQLPTFFRQVLDTSTINLASAPEFGGGLAAGTPLRLPLTFFLNADALGGELRLNLGIEDVPTVDGGPYLDCLKQFAVRLSDGDHVLPGDTPFPFVVPEPAFEDILILRGLKDRGVCSDRLAACLLMVDFPNAVFSRARAGLLQYVPESSTAAAFGPAFVDAVRAAAAALPPDRAEHAFLAHWDLGETAWRPAFETRIRTYLEAVVARLAAPGGFEPVFRLAESRRREFRKRPLAEFRLTTPLTNIPESDPPLEFSEAGDVRSKPTS